MPALSPAADSPTDQAAWLEHLVACYHQGLYRYAYRLAGNSHDAEDLTQVTFLSAQQRWMQVENPERIQSWLFAILRNSYLDHLRRKRPELTDQLDSDPYWVSPPPNGEIDEEQLQYAVAELSPEFRVVVLMYYFEDLSYRDIAEALNVPLGTVMSRLSRAKSHLRRRLDPEAATRADRPPRSVSQSAALAPAQEDPRA